MALPITALLGIGSQLIDKIWPDKTEQDKAKLRLLELEKSGELAALSGQLEINKMEAQHRSMFVAGWRPGSGWIANAGLAYTFIVQPLLAWVSAMKGWPVPPVIDTEVLLLLLGSLLGVGTLRTVEKAKGVAR